MKIAKQFQSIKKKLMNIINFSFFILLFFLFIIIFSLFFFFHFLLTFLKKQYLNLILKKNFYICFFKYENHKAIYKKEIDEYHQFFLYYLFIFLFFLFIIIFSFFSSFHFLLIFLKKQYLNLLNLILKKNFYIYFF